MNDLRPPHFPPEAPEPSAGSNGHGRPARAEPARVAVVHAQRMLSDALTMQLGKHPSIDVVLSTSDPEVEPAAIVEKRPAVLLLDADLPDGRAFEIAQAVRAGLPATQIVFLAGNLGTGQLDRMLLHSTNSVVSKTDSLPDLLEHILRAAGGEARFSADVARMIAYDRRERRYRPRHDAAIRTLNAVQLDILRYLADGETVRDIAHKLQLSPKSVESHSYRVMKAVGVTNRIELARFAIREGLVQP